MFITSLETPMFQQSIFQFLLFMMKIDKQKGAGPTTSVEPEEILMKPPGVDWVES
jgi:hypothetical protein